MRVGILGPLQVVGDGEPDGGDHSGTVEIGGARLRALLTRLALDAGRPVTVDSLAEAVWAEDPPGAPAHALQSLMTRLRRALPEESALRSVPRGYCLDLPPEAVDALRFERLARDGRSRLRAGETEAAARSLREALGLWRGAALTDVAPSPHAVTAAARLEELRLTALEDRIEADLALGTGQPVPELEELTAAQPLRERSRGLLIRALHADGRQAEALAAYEAFRTLLSEELGTDPGEELRAVHLAVLRGEDVDRRRRRGNLRAPITSFVGREQERQLLRLRLEQGRLVTLVGTGGAGKTRLASTVAADLQQRTPGGAWFVELAALTDPDDLPGVIGSALDLRDAGVPDTSSGPRDPMTRLAEALSSVETLLMLDNCEHLLDGVARIVDELLGRCPQLRVLATSREPLGITGEALCTVLPLELPDATDSAERSPAVRLFVDRAAAARPGFALTDENRADVTEVCRRLDGLPLAIELAAARLRAMSPRQLVERLDDRFQVLTGGSRTGLPKHRTLAAVVDWSWDLLSDDERRSADRLAIFPSSFTPAAAGQLGVSQSTLDALVDKSLLQVADENGQRYRMLETIREYGSARLEQHGASTGLRAAHAEFFLGLAERAAPHLQGPDQLSWIPLLAAERDNLLATLHFARETGDAVLATRLGAALGLYWTIRGDNAEAAGRLRAVLDVPGEAPRDARLTAMAAYLFNAVLAGETADARARADEIQALTGSDGPLDILVESLHALVMDRPDVGLAAIERWMHGSGRQQADPNKAGLLRLAKSFLDGSFGDMQAMRDDLAAAAENFRESGDRWGLSTSLTYLATAQMALGEFEDAIAALERSLGLARELGSDEGQRLWLAIVRLNAGHQDRARAELEALAAGASSGQHVQHARLILADLARHQGDLAEAGRQLDVAGNLGTWASHNALYLLGLGHLAAAKRELDEAERHLREALRLAVDMPDMPLVAAVAVGVASLVVRRGDATAAAEMLGAAHGLRGTADAFGPDVVRLTGELSSALSEHAYRAAYECGRGLNRPDALALIRAGVGDR